MTLSLILGPVLVKLAGGRGWEKFSRKSHAAPVAIKVRYQDESKLLTRVACSRCCFSIASAF